MVRVIALFVGILFGAVPVLARDQVTTYQLENGMDIVVIEDHRAPVVVHMVWYRAGSADEPAGSSGVAHFLEHLLFKGTDTLAPGEFSSTVARNGGSDNAFTSYDYTAYYQRVAADRLELMMKMEADRMVNLKLSEDDIRTERDVIIEERNQRVENDPGALFREQRNAVQYLNHRYGVPVIGWRHEMEALDQAKARAFYDRFYTPNNAILVVAGDVKPEEVRALAEKHYGRLKPNPDLPQRVRAVEPPQTAERRMIFRDARVAQPYIMRSYLAPERDSNAQEMAAALTVLAEVLGGGTTSVLTEELQFKTSKAVFTGAYYSGLSLDQTTFNFVVVPSQNVSLQAAEEALDATLADFLEKGIDPDHLARIKRQLLASEIYARDNVEGLANLYGRALTQGLSLVDVQAWPDVLQATTADNVMAAARRLFDRRRSVTGWLMSEEVTQ